MKKNITIILTVITLLFLNVLPIYAQEEDSRLEAKVIENIEVEEIKNDDESTSQIIQKVNVRILEGEYENEEYEMQYVLLDNDKNVKIKSELKEEESILVSIEEKDGEIAKVNFEKIISNNYTSYIIILIVALLILIIWRKKAIKPLIIFLVTILSIYLIFLINISRSVNLILLASITAISIIVLTSVIVNGVNKKMIVSIFFSLVGILGTCLIIYVIINSINVSGNLWSRGIEEAYIDIDNLVIAVGIILSSILSVIASSIVVELLKNTKIFYKTKSDNIIEGQRSLKL